ncbi:MAG: pantoate kinase [Candidatus Thermoplasmatota archaeon]
MNASAFAPGHISAFFEPKYHPNDVYRSGSRGAGICITLGATTTVSLELAEQQHITVYINNQKSEAPVTTHTVLNLIGTAPFNVNVQTTLDLPLSQGFGMSAAGALSTALAVAKILQRPHSDAIRAAHKAEIENHTGLGDVIACSFGGVEIRREAGLPPWGMLEHIPACHDVVICVVGEKLETKKILTDRNKLEEIAALGRYCTKKILEKPSLENLFRLAQEFSYKTGLIQREILKAIAAANKVGMASMCMLGNSVFAIGRTEQLCTLLQSFGKTYVCSISSKGAELM